MRGSTVVGRIIGASLSEPHTSDTTYFRSVHLCMYVCIYISEIAVAISM